MVARWRASVGPWVVLLEVEVEREVVVVLVGVERVVAVWWWWSFWVALCCTLSCDVLPRWSR